MVAMSEKPKMKTVDADLLRSTPSDIVGEHVGENGDGDVNTETTKEEEAVHIRSAPESK